MIPETSAAGSRAERLRRDWVELAGGEPVIVEEIGATFYGFCSEIAAYRIERKYDSRPKCQAGYSETRRSWYCRLETDLGAESPVSLNTQESDANLATEANTMRSAREFLAERRADLAHAGDDNREYHSICSALDEGSATPHHVATYLLDEQTQGRLNRSGSDDSRWGRLVLSLLRRCTLRDKQRADVQGASAALEITLIRPAGRGEVCLRTSLDDPRMLVVIGLPGLPHGSLIGMDAQNRSRMRQWLDAQE